MARADALLRAEDRHQTSLKAMTSEELDELISAERTKAGIKVKPAPLTSDEQFLRRLTLDVAGRLPTTAELENFIADKDPRKRARRIDALLESDDYARHWAHYWSEVLSARVSRFMQRLTPLQEEWLYEQFRRNRHWGDIVTAMLTAEAVLTDTVKQPDPGSKQPLNGAAFFVATRFYEKTRTEGAIDVAAETARIFLGIQLQCAQCHDHPFDQWERVQFHQLAAYFARSGGRPGQHSRYGGQGALGSWAFVYYPDGEYEMSDIKDVNRHLLTHPAFLDGAKAGEGQSDKERRAALAQALVSKTNYWFAAAHVNRLWGELMGEAFYEPVDDMGPQRDAVLDRVLTRMTGAFRASDYDIKDLLRTILNSRTYQQQFRERGDEHSNFTARVPSRRETRSLWQSLNDLLQTDSGKRHEDSPFARPRDAAAEFFAEFQFEPGSPTEKTLPQALLLMNGPTVNRGVLARGESLLGRLLKEHGDDTAVIRGLYELTLGRKPTDREIEKCKRHVAKVGKRGEALEDIFWVLINSAEFQLQR